MESFFRGIKLNRLKGLRNVLIQIYSSGFSFTYFHNLIYYDNSIILSGANWWWTGSDRMKLISIEVWQNRRAGAN